jgi:hypothetical protein
MKTKSIVIISIILLYSLSIQAQMKFGIRAGISSTLVKLENFNSLNYKLEYNRGDFGYHAGVISQLKITKLFIQPELLFSVTKADVAFSDFSTGSPKQLGRQNFYSLDLPVIAGVKLGAFKIEIGPEASWIINSKSAMMNDNHIDLNLNTITFGYQAGIGVELESLIIDAKYQGALSDLGTGMNVGNSSVKFTQRMSEIIVSMGYLF